MTRGHKTDHPTVSLAAQVERSVTNNDPGDRMFKNIVEPFAGTGTLFNAEPVVDLAAVTGPTEGLLRSDAGDTSRLAARLVQIRTGTQRAKVLIYLVQRGPATDPEIADALGLSPNSERPRRVELVSGGYVADSGAVRQHHGSDHVLWSATDAGRAAAGELAGAA